MNELNGVLQVEDTLVGVINPEEQLNGQIDQGVDVIYDGDNVYWHNIKEKPFDTIGDNLIVENRVLKVNTINQMLEDNTRPITSGAVYTEVGNIEVILSLL